MREILFRGRKTDDEKWVYGFYVHLYCISKDMETHRIYDHFAATDCGDFYPDWYEVDAATVGQYTGLLDKNGVRIFEGDIIRMHGNKLDLAVIHFGEFGCVDVELEAKTDKVIGWYYKPLPTDAISQVEPFCWEFQLNEMWVRESGIEVIGNIHDNPELLEGGDHE